MSTTKRVVTRARMVPIRRAPPDGSESFVFTGLHWMAAGMYLATAAEAAATFGAAAKGGPSARLLPATRWAPLVVTPFAVAAHAARAIRRDRETRTAARIVSGIAVGSAAIAATAGLLQTLRTTEPAIGRQADRPSGLRSWLRLAAPLAFGVTGVMGFVLDREERREASRQRRLERRARVIERLVPRRKPRLDRIVVHT